MDESDSCSDILELSLLGFSMKVRNNPVKIGNNVLTFVTPYVGDKREFVIPEHVRRTYNKVSVSNNTVYLNGYKLDADTGEWRWSLKAKILDLIL